MMPRIHCGTFESEAYWREPNLAKLPSLPDTGSSRIIGAMDEMLFAFCGPQDGVLTVRQMNDAHVAYLHTVGFRFIFNRFDLYRQDNKDSGEQPNVFQLMTHREVAEDLVNFFPERVLLEPFAVLPGTEEAAKQYGLEGIFPSQDVIRYVNTKCYSLRVRDRLGIPNVGVIVENVAALLDTGARLLQKGPFLIKDDYGVSGKGNQLIDSERTLQRIAKYLSGQVAKGKQVRFILEPYLQKRDDFSSQFRVEQDGTVTLISVQQLVNNGLAFGASCSADPALLETLDGLGYFELMRKVGAQLYVDGYYGDVCVDSMVLQSGDLAPLVEINARKSMSLIKHAIESRLDGSARMVCLTHITAINNSTTDFPALLERLREQRLLFETGRDAGILPLTSGTMFHSSSINVAAPMRGRLYIAVACDSEKQRVDLLTDFARVVEEAGLQVRH
jgi:hypothetical protein